MILNDRNVEKVIQWHSRFFVMFAVLTGTFRASK